MKNLLKGAILVVLMLIMVVTLTGCGNKLLATKTSNEDGVEMKEKHEFKFEGDKLNSIKMTYEFNDEESAKMMSELMKIVFTETEVNENIVIINVDAEKYASEIGGFGEEMTKESIKKSLEAEGYTVK